MLIPSLRARLCALGFLLSIYLAGILLLSTVSLDGDSSSNRKHSSDVSKAERSTQTHRTHKGASSNFNPDVGIGIRPGTRRSRLHWCHPLKYLTAPRAVVALASFPGSGNTWLRYLLQQATGIYTGSVYKDYGLLKNGFPAESVMNGSVVVVKTHEWGPSARKPYSKAVLLIRPPGPAIQAEFNRQSGGHIGFASPDRYRRNRGKYWENFVREKLNAWKNTNLDWLYNFTGPKYIIFYEDLVAEVEKELKTILTFLNYTVSEEDMKCAMDRREGIYKRKKRALAFDPYTPVMKETLQKEQSVVYTAVRTYLEENRSSFNESTVNVEGR